MEAPPTATPNVKRTTGEADLLELANVEQEEDTELKKGEQSDVGNSRTPLPITSTNSAEMTETAMATFKQTDSHASRGDTQTRLNALLQDREALREEVTRLRQSLEQLQSKHDDQLGRLNEELMAARAGKESAQEQYQSLLGRVNTLRTQLTERLKADAEQLAEAHAEIEELKTRNLSLAEDGNVQRMKHDEVVREREEQSKELSTLRNRATLSQQNWNEERDDLIQREALAREEFENAKQAMQDWEILAMEERNIRQGVEARMAELQDEAGSQRDDLEQMRQHRTTQSNAIEGLQNGLQEIQEARKQELREIVEKTQAEITQLRDQANEARRGEAVSKLKADNLQQDLDRILPLEAELKEKNLLIGKLRHEAVILNDHLTKALRQLKRGKTEDVIDRQLVTNHFLQFLGLAHGDPKKFQILQLIAAMLNWTDGKHVNILGCIGRANGVCRAARTGWPIKARHIQSKSSQPHFLMASYAKHAQLECGEPGSLCQRAGLAQRIDRRPFFRFP